MNAKVAIAIVAGIVIVIGAGYGISNSESNEKLELTLDDESVEPQNNEGKQVTLQLSDSVKAKGP